MVALNYRHEKFCLALFQGMSQKDAAIQAGYSAKTARQIGSRLLTKVDIVARLQELQSLAASEKIMSVRERKECLSEIARHEIEAPVTAGHVITAIAEMNKMEGSYAPEKSAALVGVQVVNIRWEDLGPAEREKLLSK